MSEPTQNPSTTPTVFDPVRARIQQRATDRAVARELRNKSWGKDIGEEGVKALSLWTQRHGIEPATEVEVLGGNIYLTAAYYRRRLAQLIGEHMIDYAVADHVEVDERLDALAADEHAPPQARENARAEVYRRKMERIAHKLPESAKAAVVYRIKVKGMTTEITGAKAVGGFRGKGANGRDKDPVGEEFPSETAETRAARRAARQIIDSFPTLKAEMDVVEAEAKLVAVEVQQSRAEVRAAPRQPSLMSGRPVGDLGGYDDEFILGPVSRTGAPSASNQGSDLPLNEPGDAAEDDDLDVDRKLAARDEAEAKDAHQDMDAAERRGER